MLCFNCRVCSIPIEIVYFHCFQEVLLTLRFLNPGHQPCNLAANTSNRPDRPAGAGPLEIDPVPGMGHKGALLEVAPQAELIRHQTPKSLVHTVKTGGPLVVSGRGNPASKPRDSLGDGKTRSFPPVQGRRLRIQPTGLAIGNPTHQPTQEKEQQP